MMHTEVMDLRQDTRVLLEQLLKSECRIWYGYPSVFSLLAAHGVAPSGNPRGPRLIVTHGEILTPAARAAIRDAFRCEVRETYGCAEAYRIASECRYGRLHIPPSVARVEEEPGTREADGTSRLLITPLYLRAMPLLRYRVGDRGALAADPCPCGSALPALLRVIGRSDDFLVLASGRRISARAVNLLEEVPGILEYRIVQTAPDRFLVEVRPGDGFDAGSERHIRAVLAAGCAPDPAQVDIRRVEVIPRSPNGKLRAVVSEVAR
jgi:phenylacetate-CoA ligase